MASRQRNAVKAGAFIVFSIVAIAAVIVGIRGIGNVVERHQELHVVFALRTDLGGLRTGDEVRVGGFAVGEVRSIDLVSTDDPRVRAFLDGLPEDAPLARLAAQGEPHAMLVTIAVPRQYAAALRQDARIVVQTTLTGGAAINFESLGTATASAHPAGTPLVGSATGFAEVLASLQDVRPMLAKADRILDEVRGAAAQVNRVTVPAVNSLVTGVRDDTLPRANAAVDAYRDTAVHATALVDQVRGHVDPLAGKVHRVGDSATAMMDEVRDLFGDTKTDFRGTVANLNAATGSLKDRMPGLLEKVDAALVKVNVAIAGVNEAMADIKLVSANAAGATGAVREVLETHKGRIERLITSATKTMENAEDFTGQVARSPWRLLYKPKKEDLANDNIYVVAQDFATGAAELHDAARTFQDYVRSDKADPRRVDALLRNVEDALKRFQETQDKLARRQLWEGLHE